MRIAISLAAAAVALTLVPAAPGAGISNWKELCANRPSTVGCDPAAPGNPATIPELESRLRQEIADGPGNFWCWSNCIRIAASVDAIVAEAVQERRQRTIDRILTGLDKNPLPKDVHPTAEEILDATATTRKDGPVGDGLLGQGVDTELAALERDKARKETDRLGREREAQQLTVDVVRGLTVGEVAVRNRSGIGATGQPLWGETGLVQAIEDYNFWYNPELVSSRAMKGGKWDANRIGPDDTLKVPSRAWVEEWYRKHRGGAS